MEREGEAFRLYLVGLGFAASSVRAYVQQRRRWLSFLRSSGIEVVSKADVQVYLASLGHRSPSTLRLALYGVRHYYRFLGGDDPTTGIKIRKQNPRRPAEPFSSEEQRALYRACRTPLDRALYLLLIDTGMRAGELLALTAADVDWYKYSIRVLGKGGKYRTLTASDRTFQALTVYFESGHGFWANGHRPSYQWLDEWFKGLGRRAGIAPPIHLHRMRSTFAVNFCEAGGGIDLLQTVLGHQDIGMSIWYSRRGREQRALEAMRRLSPVDSLGT